MKDFRDAFKRGQIAWLEASRARAEINEAFDRFALRVQEASNDCLLVRRETRTLQGRTPRLDPWPYEVVIMTATAAPEDPGEEIGRFEISEMGFPVTLRSQLTEERCPDTTTFEEGLTHLLKTWRAGRLIVLATKLGPESDFARWLTTFADPGIEEIAAHSRENSAAPNRGGPL